MVKLEKEYGQIRISIVLDGYTDIELLDCYKKALLDAIQCISSTEETLNTWGKACYDLASLLRQMEFDVEQQQEIELCAKMNQKRLEALKKIPQAAEFNKDMTKEQRELKSLLFD